MPGLGRVVAPFLIVGGLSCRLHGRRSGWRLIGRALRRAAVAIALSRNPTARGHAELRSLSAVLAALRTWIWPPAALLLVACGAFLSGALDGAGTIIATTGGGALAAVAVAAFGYLWRTRSLRLTAGRVMLVELDGRLAMIAPVARDEARVRNLVLDGKKPFVVVDPGDRIFETMLRDLVLLPRAVVAPVVRFYEEERASEALLREIGGTAFDSLELARKLDAVGLYHRLLIRAEKIGGEARRRLRWYLRLRPVWPL